MSNKKSSISNGLFGTLILCGDVNNNGNDDAIALATGFAGIHPTAVGYARVFLGL
ncbi:MAG: hypothetical protein Q8P90_05580 [bacterium]|nr:hypothetical protein [bacterium]